MRDITLTENFNGTSFVILRAALGADVNFVLGVTGFFPMKWLEVSKFVTINIYVVDSDFTHCMLWRVINLCIT